MTKIKKLSFIFVGLLVVSLALNWVGNKEKISSSDKLLFAIADTTQISVLTITSKADTITIKREDNQWTLNGQYHVDPQLVYLSQRILSAVQTQRPVSRSNFEGIKSELVSSGRQVRIELSNGRSKTFYAGGNAAKTTAYFGKEDLSEIYTVSIPGYKSYLSGIFELSLNQWRDRVLFASSWRTIQKLSIDYTAPEKRDLSISFDNSFLKVESIAKLDTTVLMKYLQPLEYFQLNDYLDSGSFPRYDSLLEVEPLAKLTLEDIDISKNSLLTVFPIINGERFYLLTDESNQMIVVDQQRMDNLLAEPSLFDMK